MPKKVFCILVALGIVASSGFAAAVQEPATSMDKAAIPLAENTTITYFIDMPRQEERHELHKILEERTNINLEIVPSDPDKVPVLLASGDFPDIMYVSVGSTGGPLAFNQFGEQGVLVDFMEYMDQERMPNYKDLMERLPGLKDFIISDRNQLFGLGSVTLWKGKIDPNYAYAFYYSDLWKENNIPVPQTFNDIFEGGKKIKARHPDKYVFGGVWGNPQDWVFNSYHVPWSPRRNHGITFDLDTNEFKFMPVTDNFRDALRWLNKAYDAGLVDPEFVTNDFTQYTKKAENDEITMDVFYFDWTWLQWPDGYIGPPPMTDTGLKARVTAFSPFGSWAHVVNANSDHVDEAIALLDWGLSEEAQLLFNWGVEGVTFEYGADDQPMWRDSVKTGDNPDGTFEAADPGFGLFAGWNIMFLRDNGHMQRFHNGKAWQDVADQVWEYGLDRDTVQIQPPALIVPTETGELISLTMAPTNTYVEESIIDFILGDMDVERDWSSYVRRVNENRRISEMVDTMNRLYKEQYADNGRTWGVDNYFER